MTQISGFQFSVLAALVLPLAGCGQPVDQSPTDDGLNAANQSPSVPAAGDVDAAFRLGAVEGNATAGLKGELGCSFSSDERLLLVARANVGLSGPIQAVIDQRVPVLLTSAKEGSFGDLEGGLSFVGDGVQADVTLGEANPTGTEESRHDATLRVSGSDAPLQSFDGIWTCGP